VAENLEALRSNGGEYKRVRDSAAQIPCGGLLLEVGGGERQAVDAGCSGSCSGRHKKVSTCPRNPIRERALFFRSRAPVWRVGWGGPGSPLGPARREETWGRRSEAGQRAEGGPCAEFLRGLGSFPRPGQD
jgi:hypothetical protein